MGVLGQIITILLGLILPKFFITSFGSETNGLISSITQIYVYINLLEAGVGTATLQALYKPISENNKQKINSILSATSEYYKKTGYLYLIAIAIFSVCFPFIAKSSLGYTTVVLIVIFTGLSGVVNYFFQGKYCILLEAEGKNYIILSLNTLINILTSIVKIILIINKFDVLFVQFSFFLVNLIQMIVIEYIIKKDYDWINLSETPDYSSISQKNSVLIHQISYMIFSNTDILILTLFTNLRVVSVYTVYNLFFRAISQILSIANNSATFALGQLYASNKERYTKMVDANEFIFFILSYIFYTTLFIGLIPFLRVYTDGFPSDINYIDIKLAFLFLLIEIIKVAKPVMNNVINVAGHFKQTQNRAIIEMAINLVVSLIGVYFLGIYGVLIGTIIALVYRSNDFVIYVNKKILNRLCVKTYLRWGLNTVVLFGTVLVGIKFNFSFSGYFNAFYTYLMILITVSIIYIFINIMVFKDDLAVIIGFIRNKLSKYNQ